MQKVAQETVLAYERRMDQAKVPPAQRPHYHKWTRFYLDFCHKYAHPPRSPNSLEPFLAKLAATCDDGAEPKAKRTESTTRHSCEPSKLLFPRRVRLGT